MPNIAGTDPNISRSDPRFRPWGKQIQGFRVSEAAAVGVRGKMPPSEFRILGSDFRVLGSDFGVLGSDFGVEYRARAHVAGHPAVGGRDLNERGH
eukprot:740227-Rhodomonas_salina.1